MYDVSSKVKITREKLKQIIKEEVSLICEQRADASHPQVYLSGADPEEIEKINTLSRHEDNNLRPWVDSLASQFGYTGDSYSRDLFFYDFEQKHASEFARIEGDDIIITARLPGAGGDDVKIWNRWRDEFFKHPNKTGFGNLVAQWSMKNMHTTLEDLYKSGGGNNKQHVDAFLEIMDRVFSAAGTIYITVDDIETWGLQDVVAKHQDKTELRHYN